MKATCMLQTWVFEEGVGWRENPVGVCSGLTKSEIGTIMAEDRCGTPRCPFFKPAELGRPDEIIRSEDANGRPVFIRRKT